MSGVRYLCGSFACYSPAWSPYAQGKLIRGSLRIAPLTAVGFLLLAAGLGGCVPRLPMAGPATR